MKKTIVLALGGNALLQSKEKPSIEIQFKNAKNVIKEIVKIKNKYNLVLTHGNGPQVGNILLQVEAAAGTAYKVPLEVCVAESQGEIGYILEQTLQNQTPENLPVVNIVTQVLVNKTDSAFKNPTKFIGPFYKKSQASHLSKKGMIIKKDSNRGYRRVVPSPKPLKIVEFNVISSLVKQNIIVIAAGGGGIPVIKENKKLKGIEAVIDKDLASECLASSIKADYFIMLTAVPYVYINFGAKNQQSLKKISLETIKKYYKQGQFPPGSMGPKIEAAINFLNKNPKGIVIITEPSKLSQALKEKDGTIITK